MKVLVIGGTLFIGRLLVEELVKGGHEVAVLHRKPKHDFGRRVENIMADRNDAAKRDEMLEAKAEFGRWHVYSVFLNLATIAVVTGAMALAGNLETAPPKPAEEPKPT